MSAEDTAKPQVRQDPAPQRIEAAPLSPLSRNIRQLGLYFAGAGFLAASIAISRRAVVRRQIDAFPKFFMSNRTPARLDSTDRSLLAAQALGLATLNVMSFGILLVGGVSWGFDLCSVGELRERSRASLRKPGKVNVEDEEAMKEMMDELLAKLGMQLPKEGEEGEEGAEGEGGDKPKEQQST